MRPPHWSSGFDRRGRGAERFARQVSAGTIEQHADRVRGLAEIGVGTVMVSLADLDDTAPIERFAEVIRRSRG